VIDSGHNSAIKWTLYKENVLTSWVHDLKHLAM